MTEKLIPLLRNIKTKEPSVTLASLAVYAEMGTKLGHDVIAIDIIPALWPMTVGVLLNMEQVPLDDIVSNVKFNRLMGVIRELETKVIKQQTQKLQELGTSVTSKGAISPMQENASLGPMEETSLDFENLVLGKKSPPTNNIPSSSPPIATYQSQAFPQPQGFNNSRPNTPMSSIMTPMQPTSQTPPPPASNTFFQPLKPSPYTATTGPSSVATPRNGLYPTSNATFNAPNMNSTSAFSANAWSTPALNLSLPTIAPPPAKASGPMNQGHTPQANSSGNSGLEKYQSLL